MNLQRLLCIQKAGMKCFLLKLSGIQKMLYCYSVFCFQGIMLKNAQVLFYPSFMPQCSVSLKNNFKDFEKRLNHISKSFFKF